MAPSLSAMLLVDLSSLHADAVLVRMRIATGWHWSSIYRLTYFHFQQYVSKVLQLQPQRNSVSAVSIISSSIG